jgi:HAD superfamily hydrolase (TIGR01450 family)
MPAGRELAMRSRFQACGFLVDVDGTLISSGQPLPEARQFLSALRDRFVLVSNDAEHTPDELAHKLQRIQLPVPAERIVLAGTTAIDDVATEKPGARAMLLASASLQAYARQAGLWIVDNEAEVVILGRDRHFTYDKLAAAANAIRGGATLVVANPDLVHPGPRGAIVPETGALLAALLTCTGRVPYRVVGKPEPALFTAALALLGALPEDTVMIGDNPATDGEGARRLGIGYIEVHNGRFPHLAIADKRAEIMAPASYMA